MSDADFQGAVDLEADRLLRMTSCELMQISSGEVPVQWNGKTINVFLHIRDFGAERHIGILACRDLVIGHRKFSRGVKIKLETTSMTEEEAASLYD
jgi:hypothetical protein